MPLVNPMDAFKQGQMRGSVNSPVSGIGAAIKGILADARSKGLLQAQSQFQTAGANQNAIDKEDRAATAEALPRKTIIAGATPVEDRTFNEPGTTDIMKGSAPDPLKQIMAGILSTFTPKTDTPGVKEEVTPPPDDTNKFTEVNSKLKDATQSQATAQEGDDEVITIRFKNGATAQMTVGQARAKGYPIE